MTEGSGNGTPKTILFLKSNPLALQSAEQFLRTRGWTTYSTTGLADSVQLLFERKIDYFLICANHPQKKVKTFPKLLSQFQNLKLITYTDIANTLNMSILHEMGIPYQILPPVSGPAIERIIFRIEKDILNYKDNPKSGGPRGFLDNLAQSAARKKAQETMSQFLTNEGEENLPQFEALETESTETKINSEPESFAEYEERIRCQSSSVEYSSPKKAHSGTSEEYPYLTENKSQTDSEFDYKTPEVFRKGIEHAVEGSVKSTESPLPVEKLDRAQNCICLKIEADTFKGFLVAAMGQNRKFDELLLESIQSKLFEFLKIEGLIINGEKPMEIKVRPVHFESWAIDKADFLKKSIHDGNEVAMAFFPVEKTTPNFGKSEAVDMISIDIDDLATDTPVTFDVYVHLPANNKYILYTPKGGLFMTSQKDRLKSKGVTKMHTKKDLTDDVKKYHAENTLNNSIVEFESESNKKQKKA